MTGRTETVSCPPEIREALGGPDPTAEQWRAVSMPLEPYVVVAGAGSGKTSVIAARVVYLALAALGRIEAPHGGVLPGNVLCLTFTNKATEYLTLRVRRALRAVDLPEGEEPTILNYHGFAAEVLDRYGLHAGIEPGQRILSPAQRVELCAGILDEVAFEHVNAEWQPSLIANILSLAEQAANHRVAPAEIVAFVERRLEALQAYRSEQPYRAALQRIELARAVDRFERRKRELGVMDFGDQITMALEVVERFPDVCEDFRSRVRAVVLDEYQDTNVAQADLIAGVFGKGFPLMAVGDPDQNIYAWRGASLFNLLEFPERFRRSDGTPAQKLPLYTNFRSGSRILGAADTVIAPLPASQRPDPDKALVPWGPNGEGAVEVRRVVDEWSEARWIGDRVRAIHDEEGGPWSDVAVLCRKSRLFVAIQEAFGERGIPIEIVGLAGLLRLPEVVEVLAYARAVADPFASVELARILLGPRYRVGYKDLARVAAWAKERNYRRREEDGDEAAPFLFAEALEHLGEITDLTDQGRARLDEFRSELAALRGEASRPVGDFLAEVIRRTGLLAELDASPDPDVTRATKRNLAAFLDEVHAFSPLEGELTLRAFLDYADTVEAGERQEWSPVQPSEEDSVKVMTIHQAKGLEFDTVFVPGLAHEILPDMTVQQNPAERGKSLDFELRGDRAILPAFTGNLRQFWQSLRDQELIEERRTLYVALTRAKRRLVVSGAHWYGEGSTPKKESAFIRELADWGERTGMAMVDRGPPPPDLPEENPVVGYRERFVRDWPGPARRNERDDLFPDGWRAAAGAVARDPHERKRLAESLPEPDRLASERLGAEQRALAEDLIRHEQDPAPAHRLPATIAVGGVVDYETCPKRFYWSTIRPLPRFSGPAARIGSQIHAWIERKSSGQTSLLELEEAPDLTAEELAGEPGKVDRLQQAFLRSRFASAVPLFAERPFLLHLGGFVISGRIDAIYARADGGWEVVDYKTGRMPDQGDPLAGLQLDLYALACAQVWGKDPSELTLTYLYLGSGTEVSRPAGDVEAVRERVLAGLRRMDEGRFDPQPGSYCRWCDFLPFCDAGTAFMEGATASPAGP